MKSERKYLPTVESTHSLAGVNLGNWLVLEKWMGGSPLAAASAEDDYGFIGELDDEERAQALEEHYRTYVTEKDFAFLAQVGVDIARIPLPYHLFGSDHHPSCVSHLDNAFCWAERYGIGLLLDLHTVPLSQNGFDNGGYAGICAWHRDNSRILYVLDVLERIASRYAHRPALWGLEPLNEPASWPVLMGSLLRHGGKGAQGLLRVRRALSSRAISLNQLKGFYKEFYDRIRPIVGSDVQLVFHDRFSLGAWDDWHPNPTDKNIWIDTHQYACFADAHLRHRDLAGYLRVVEGMGKDIDRAARFHRVMVGEWCLGNHAEELGRMNADEQRDWYRRYADAQLAAWGKGGGSCFWSLRVEGERRANWSFEECVRRGWLELGASGA